MTTDETGATQDEPCYTPDDARRAGKAILLYGVHRAPGVLIENGMDAGLAETLVYGLTERLKSNFPYSTSTEGNDEL